MESAATLVARCWKNRATRRLLRMIPDVRRVAPHATPVHHESEGADKVPILASAIHFRSSWRSTTLILTHK